MLNNKSALMQPQQRKGLLILFVLVFCGLFFYLRNYYLYLFQTIVFHFRSSYEFTDFCDQWKLCALTLRGVDPYTQIGAAVPAIPDIGSIRPDWGTSPWGLISGNLFYFGFLPFAAARYAFLILSIAALAALSAALFLSAKKRSLPPAVSAAVLTVCSTFFLLSLFFENSGMICCSFVIIACLTAEKRPYLSGALLGFALVKPQVVLPVCLVLLLFKKFKPLFTAAGMNVVFYIAACIFTKKGPVSLLSEFLSAGIGGESQYYGIFNFLHTAFSVPSNITMYASMVFCTALLIPVILLSKKYLSREPAYVVYFAPCVIASFWSYSGKCDWLILMLPCCALIIDFFESKRFMQMLISGGFLVFAYFREAFNIFANKMLNLLSGVIPQFGVFTTVESWGDRSVCDILLLILTALYFCCKIIGVRKKNGENRVIDAEKTA